MKFVISLTEPCTVDTLCVLRGVGSPIWGAFFILENRMKTKLHKPRDPHVVHLLKRKSGAHVKTHKALRKAQKMRDKKDYSNDTLVQYGVM